MSQRPSDRDGFTPESSRKAENGATADKSSPVGNAARPPKGPRVVKLVAALLVLSPLAFCGVLSFAVYDCTCPRDRLAVSISGLPKGTYFACVLAYSRGVPRAMDWSPSHVFGPFTMHPDRCILSYTRPDDPDQSFRGTPIQWQYGERYGVLTRGARDGWRVAWIDSKAVPIQGRSFLTGGGTVILDLTTGQTEPVSDEEVESLGLGAVRQP